MTLKAPAAGRYRGWLVTAGIMLTVVSAAYLGLYAWRNWEQLPSLRLSADGGGWLLISCALYFASLLTTSGAWVSAIRALGGAMPTGAAVGVALVSQIGKYAPGNVAHHVGRAALAKDRGLPLTVTAQASVLEIAVVVVASAAVAFTAGLFSPALPDLALPHGRILIAAIGALLLIGGIGAVVWFRRSAAGAGLLPGAARMLACYCLSFAFAGLSYYAVARSLGEAPSLSLCIAVYALAWVVGFITPGAPAGLGVRESILVAALSSSLGPAAIAIAIVHRLVTAFTDALAAGVGALVLAREPR